MGWLDRVLLQARNVRVSRRGVSVTNPPSRTPEHMALNSDWLGIARIHTMAVLRNTTLMPSVTVNFSDLSEPPFGLLILKQLANNPDPDLKFIQDMITHSTDMPRGDNVRDYSEDQYIITAVKKGSASFKQVVKEEFVNGKGFRRRPDRTPRTFIFLAIEA